MKRILVIEDDRELLIGLKDNLEVEGYEVVTAADGDIGVTRAVDARRGDPRRDAADPRRLRGVP